MSLNLNPKPYSFRDAKLAKRFRVCCHVAVQDVMSRCQ